MGQQEPQEQQISEPPILAQRPTMVRYQVLTAACTVAVVAYIHRVGFSRALPAIQNDLSLSDFQTGVLAAVFSLAYGAFEIPYLATFGVPSQYQGRDAIAGFSNSGAIFFQAWNSRISRC